MTEHVANFSTWLQAVAEIHIVHTQTGEPKATFYLLQRLSVAVQRGNCALINGCIG